MSKPQYSLMLIRAYLDKKKQIPCIWTGKVESFTATIMSIHPFIDNGEVICMKCILQYKHKGLVRQVERPLDECELQLKNFASMRGADKIRLVERFNITWNEDDDIVFKLPVNRMDEFIDWCVGHNYIF